MLHMWQLLINDVYPIVTNSMIFYLIAIRYVQAMLKHSHSFFHYLYM